MPFRHALNWYNIPILYYYNTKIDLPQSRAVNVYVTHGH